MFDLRDAIAKAIRSYPKTVYGDLDALAAHVTKELADAFEPTLADVDRYRWLRARDLSAIDKGGVFAGRVPENVVVNGYDLDNAIDAAMASN